MDFINKGIILKNIYPSLTSGESYEAIAIFFEQARKVRNMDAITICTMSYY